MTVLRRVQKVLERLHGGFARVQKGLEVSSWGVHVYKRALKLVQGVLRRVQKDIEVSSRGFARVQKGIEVSSRGFCTCTKGI